MENLWLLFDLLSHHKSNSTQIFNDCVNAAAFISNVVLALCAQISLSLQILMDGFRVDCIRCMHSAHIHSIRITLNFNLTYWFWLVVSMLSNLSPLLFAQWREVGEERALKVTGISFDFASHLSVHTNPIIPMAINAKWA